MTPEESEKLAGGGGCPATETTGLFRFQKAALRQEREKGSNLPLTRGIAPRIPPSRDGMPATRLASGISISAVAAARKWNTCHGKGNSFVFRENLRSRGRLFVDCFQD
ncbi:MAG: hypothetical protein DLM73_11900 [Chthoniobacterales bacterium]|nr:MAG: hypothetical protein DLM73_11900 [Chthoniobacterales bacterium]